MLYLLISKIFIKKILFNHSYINYKYRLEFSLISKYKLLIYALIIYIYIYILLVINIKWKIFHLVITCWRYKKAKTLLPTGLEEI
jgi:hypothetical protein